jgi:hypothetical protein
MIYYAHPLYLKNWHNFLLIVLVLKSAIMAGSMTNYESKNSCRMM